MATESKGVRILDALQAALEGGAGKPTGLTVHANRLRPFENEQLPAAVLYLRNPEGRIPTEDVEVVETGIDGMVRRRLLFGVECRALATSGQATWHATDPIYRWVVKTLHAAGELGGLLWSYPTETGWRHAAEEAAKGTFAGLGIEYELEYETARGDPDD